MKYGPVIFFLILFTVSSQAQKDFRVYLVGDAGDHVESGLTLVNLKTELSQHPNSAVVFLGDNCYRDILGGLIPFGYKGFDSSRNTMDKINSQLSLLNNYKGYAFFVPGNHDWWNRSTYEKGVPKLAKEESYIEENLKLNTSIANPHQTFLPERGGYGPEYVELNNHTIRLIFIDTYRIIQTGIKKRAIPEEEKTFYDRLDNIIHQGYLLNEKIIVVAHHPVHSIAPYNRPLKHPYLFTRIKASAASFPSFSAMSASINRILERYPGIYYASGHLHALQYFYTKDSVHYIVSGAGSKEHMLSKKQIDAYNASLIPGEYLLWESGGFVEVDFNGSDEKTTLYYDDASEKCVLSDP